VRTRCRGEDGTSLIIALAFLTLFALLVPALLNLGTTNLRATTKFREQRSDVYVADGATDGAIQYLRAHSSCARPIGGSCPISQFQYTDPDTSTTATTTWQFVGTAFDFDRTLSLTTTIAGVTRVSARVIFRDSAPNTSGVPVDVVSWTYQR
jgi:hypothetical protein